MKTSRNILMIGMLFAILLFTNTFVNAQDDVAGEAVTASVSCTSLGALNGVVTYEYEVTLKNNTAHKLIVNYTVIFKAGSLEKKRHTHSTILIPNEELTETKDSTMKEGDWDSITLCSVEWSAQK